ncbi:MAG: DEAD/DEAH box helicase family protein [Prevotella sp.]|nr:DEAD/DEAH box helicase family protein [Prevotella sp.]
MDYEGFLSRFRKSGSSIHKPEASLGGRQEVLFRLDFTDEGAEMTVVNAKGEALSVLPDYRLYQGGTFNVLRILDDIKSAELYSMNWGGSDKRFELRHQPALLFALLRCDQLVDGALNHITVSEDQAEIVLCLKGQEDKEGSQVKDNLITPRLMARVGDQPLQTFRLLSDVFALVGTTIHPVASLGSNYLRLAFFEEPFPKTLLEQYLSVFYSYIDNVALQYEDYTLERSQQPINTIPTLIIEKVDADMALYLRLTHSLAGVSADFVHDFDLTWQAQLSMEKQIILRRIVNTDEQEEQEHLRKAIIRHAPDRKAAKEVWQSGGEFIVPQETAGPFLLKALPELVQRYQVLGAERLREYKVKAVQPKMKLSLSSGIDFLEGTATVTLDGEEFSLRKFLQQYAKQRYVTLSDGNRALVDESYVKRLERIFKKAEKGNTDKVRVSFFDLPDIENLLQERLEGKTFEHYRGFYEGFNKLASQKMKYDGVQAKLRNYQKEGVKWLNYLYENNMGGCLADDMGLGKTLQTITMLTKVYKPHHTAGASLIVMPRSLLFNWQDELQKFAPQLTYYIYYGQQRDLAEAMKYQLVLTTYALVRNDIEVFQQQQFHYIVLDESQNIKNLTSQVTQAVMLLNGHHRLALSGTPIENNLTELYSLYRFLNPAMLGTLDEFNKQYAYPIQRDGDKEVTESLRRKIFPFMLRRLKKDVLKELPDRMEQTLYVEMDDDHRRFYEQRRQYYQTLVAGSIAQQGLEKSQMVMFQALSELRRIASVPESLSDGSIASPKIPLLTEQVEELVAGGHKVVIFFNFIAGIELVGERLTEMGIDYTTMTGSTHDRRAVVERFQNDPGCRALLMTLKTGGVGLNLTVADTVYIVEPWWNKAAEEQAINRLHRIGQKAKVMSYALITRDTIEEKIRLLQQQKQDLADSLITGDAAMTKRLTEKDIKYILG